MYRSRSATATAIATRAGATATADGRAGATATRAAAPTAPRRLVASSLVLLAALGYVSCSSSDGGPTGPSVTTGTVAVAVATTGRDAPTGYMVALDGGTARSVGASASTSFTAVSAGSHSVLLSGVPANCSVGGVNPRSSTVTAGQTASVGFSVTCVALTGTLDVTAQTTGGDVDPDGYSVSIDGAAGLALGINASLASQVLTVGDHAVELTGVATNCMVMDDNPRTVSVAASATVATTFAVVCDPTTGMIEVTATTTGADLDADGYMVDLDGMASQPIDANGTVTFTGVSEGAHSLTLTGIAANCTVSGANPASSTVSVGATDAVAFDLSCAPVTGDLRVTATTTGAPIDPDGYTVSVDGGATQPLAVNGDTVIFAATADGNRSVRLGDIGPGCTVTGGNPATVNVPGGGTATHAFAVSCTTTTGAIELTTVTTGLDTDPDGYMVSLDGGAAQAIGNDDVALFDALSAGGHTLELSDVASNCTVQGANPAMPVVMASDTTDVTMTVNCADVPNLAPVVSISAPDTTSSTAPLTTAPGSPVTFTGAANDPEEGALTGSSLLWTSNVDGQIGTGQTFMTSSLTEGQHTVTLTATDSELGFASETVLVVIVAPPAPGYQIKLRLSEGATLTPGQRSAIDGAIAKLESIITGDVADAFVARPAGSCGAAYPPVSETVDDILIYLAIEPIDGPGGIAGAAGPCLIRSGSSLPVLGGMRFDSADLTGIESAGLVDELLLHEAMHVLGFGTIWGTKGLIQDPSDPSRGGTAGNDTYFNGAQALAQFAALGGGSYTGGNIVPVENNNAVYGPGSLDGHWRESVFDKESMTPSLDLGTNPLSILTVGQFEDLGYVVDLGAADPFSPLFTLRLSGASGAAGAAVGTKIFLRDDILRGPLWVLNPDGSAVRVR